jgi:hypothetical protein
MQILKRILCLLILAPNFTAISCGKTDTPLVWNQKPVRLSEGPLSSKVQWESLADARKRRRSKAEGVTSIATSRKACGFYLWDFVSAGLYHTCQYLMKDRIYEGKGGRKVNEELSIAISLAGVVLSRKSNLLFCSSVRSDRTWFLASAFASL